MCALKIQDTVPYPRKVVTIHPRAPLMEAIELMRRNEIHHLVVTEGNKAVGVLSDRSIMQKGLAINSVVLNPIMSVGEVMHPLTQTLTDKTDVDEAIDLMFKQKTSALPLIKDGEVTGIVTESDLLVILRTLLAGVPVDAEAQAAKDAQEGLNGYKGAEDDLNSADKSQLMLGNPLVQNVMKLLSEMGI